MWFVNGKALEICFLIYGSFAIGRIGLCRSAT
jgi:hypothetical protein